MNNGERPTAPPSPKVKKKIISISYGIGETILRVDLIFYFK